MSNSLEVRFVGRDAGLPHRVLDVRFRSDLTVRTPARAFDSRLVQDYRFPQSKVPFYEAYSRATRKGTSARISDKSEELRHTYRLNALRAPASDRPFILAQDYFETTFPSDAELQYLTRIEHSYSDIVLPPLVSRFTDSMNAKSGFDRYLEFLKRSLEIIDTFNHKPVMGVIPLRTPFVRISDLVEFYTNRGITAFCLDFAANKPDTARQSIEQVLFSLAEAGQLDSAYIHALNVSPGRPRSRTKAATCYNILSFGYGVDSFGDLHRTRMAIGNPPPTPVVVVPRLFMPRDYGDYLIRTQKDLSQFESQRSSVSLKSCIGSRDVARLVNSELQAREAARTTKLILSGSGLSRVSPYLGSKAFVPKDDIQNMVAIGQQLSLRSIR
jgi:hypothetical protein